jgi:hypothetical protein
MRQQFHGDSTRLHGNRFPGELSRLRRRATSLGGLFSRTLSAVQRFLHTYLNEMFWVILNPTIRQQ